MKNTWTRWKPEKIERAIKLYQSGLAMRAIARILAPCKQETISRYLKIYHIALREQGYYYRGAKNHSWNGGRTMDKDGYIMILSPNHPYRRKHTNYVAEHRLIMEKHLKRYLLSSEVVDHINRVRNDNRIENLRLFACNADHLRTTLKGRVPKWTEEGFSRMSQANPSWQKWKDKNLL